MAGFNSRVAGTGKIGAIVAKVFHDGFGCEVLAHDLYQNDGLRSIGIQYVGIEMLLQHSDIVCLHCPLTPATHHLINNETLQLMKPGAILVNTGRGGLIDTPALIDALNSGRIRGCGLDVYEGEENFFLHGPSTEDHTDKNFKYLVNLPQVIVTGHQAFLTHGALNAIAKTTLQNIADFADGAAGANVVKEDAAKPC
jgi:D-lactate dehydrogenase